MVDDLEMPAKQWTNTPEPSVCVCVCVCQEDITQKKHQHKVDTKASIVVEA